MARFLLGGVAILLLAGCSPVFGSGAAPREVIVVPQACADGRAPPC